MVRRVLGGAKVLVAVVQDDLSADVSTDEILRSYPSLQAEDIQAAMAYAAELARERLSSLPVSET